MYFSWPHAPVALVHDFRVFQMSVCAQVKFPVLACRLEESFLSFYPLLVHKIWMTKLRVVLERQTITHGYCQPHLQKYKCAQQDSPRHQQFLLQTLFLSFWNLCTRSRFMLCDPNNSCLLPKNCNREHAKQLRKTLGRVILRWHIEHSGVCRAPAWSIREACSDYP